MNQSAATDDVNMEVDGHLWLDFMHCGTPSMLECVTTVNSLMFFGTQAQRSWLLTNHCMFLQFVACYPVTRIHAFHACNEQHRHVTQRFLWMIGGRHVTLRNDSFRWFAGGVAIPWHFIFDQITVRGMFYDYHCECMPITNWSSTTTTTATTSIFATICLPFNPFTLAEK